MFSRVSVPLYIPTSSIHLSEYSHHTGCEMWYLTVLLFVFAVCFSFCQLFTYAHADICFQI